MISKKMTRYGDVYINHTYVGCLKICSRQIRRFFDVKKADKILVKASKNPIKNSRPVFLSRNSYGDIRYSFTNEVRPRGTLYTQVQLMIKQHFSGCDKIYMSVKAIK
jgi:hypothetical protein